MYTYWKCRCCPRNCLVMLFHRWTCPSNINLNHDPVGSHFATKGLFLRKVVLWPNVGPTENSTYERNMRKLGRTTTAADIYWIVCLLIAKRNYFSEHRMCSYCAITVKAARSKFTASIQFTFDNAFIVRDPCHCSLVTQLCINMWKGWYLACKVSPELPVIFSVMLGIGWNDCTNCGAFSFLNLPIIQQC